MIRTAIITLALLSVVAAIASCGKEGPLERPTQPVFGRAQDRAAVAAQQANEAAVASNAAEANRVIGPQAPALQPYTNVAPQRDMPLPGEPTPPSGEPQGGAVPNPM
jgi:predicted small lipoprotein YifL